MSRIYTYFSILVLSFVPILTNFAQDNTQVGLPEGAIARLGKGGINVMQFSPDGARLAVGTDVGVWLYDVPDGKETALFTGHTGQVNALAFSSDGKTLASGGFGNPVIQLWELKTANELSTLDLLNLIDEKNWVVGLTFFSDDKKLIILDRYGKIAHWEIDTNIVEIVPHNIDIHNTAVFSEKDNIFAAQHKDDKIRFWDATTGRPWISNMGHDDSLEKRRQNFCVMALSRDMKLFASGSTEKSILLWDTDKREMSATLKGHKARITAVAFSNDSKTLVSGDAKNVIKLWDMGTRSELMDLSGHTSGISALVFSPDGKTLASGSNDGTIRFWEHGIGKEISTFASGHTKWVKKIAFSKNDTTLTSVDFNGKVIVWNVSTRSPLSTHSFVESGARDSVAFSQDAQLFATQENRWDFAFNPLGAGAQGSLRGAIYDERSKNIELWDISSGKQVNTPWLDEVGTVNTLQFSPDNKILVAGIDQQGISSWDINSGDRQLFHYNKEPANRRKLVFTPNGKLFATCEVAVKTRVWDFATRQEFILPELQNAWSIAFSPDGTLLAIGHPKSISLWHVTPDGLDEGISHENIRVSEALIFSPDSKTLLFSTQKDLKEYIQLLDVHTGTDIGFLSGHTERLTTLVFSHDGKTLASASWDGTVLLWDWDSIMDKMNTR